MMNQNINDDDLLGRAVFSGRQARKANRGVIEDSIFLEKPGSASLSVDRFGFCSEKELTNIQDKNAELRSSQNKPKTRSFYGWVKIKAEKACRSKRIVQVTPKEDNPYHADIILPEGIDINRDQQVAHATELASNDIDTTWTPRFNQVR